jgi:Tol biopolymer transport system component/predicted Ser/Thr protein kinase
MGEPKKPAGQYRIDGELGRGGMGVVYKALDTEKNTYVAIKTIPPDLAHHREFLERFQQEARALMRLHHPHVVGLIDLVQDQGSHYMVLEYVDGPSLSQLLTKGPLPPERARQIALEVADALRHAHGHDIVHRDIKPGNILLTREGQVKVTDFGIARILDATLGTLTGQVFGTARYASPEQVKGLKVDARSDIYSLGVVLYEMLTGRPPFLGTDDEVMEQHNAAQPVPPSELNEGVPASLEAITLRCLEKDRGSRYQSAGDLAAALRGGRVVKEPGGGEKVGGHRGRWKLTVAFAVIAVVLLMGLATLAQVVWPWFGGGGDETTVAVGSETTPAGEWAATGTASQGPAVASETELPLAVPTEAAFVATPTPFVGKIAFLSGGDYPDFDVQNPWRRAELYIMNPDGTDQRRLTFGDEPFFDSGVPPRRVFWLDERRVVVDESGVGDRALIVDTVDGAVEGIIQFNSVLEGAETYGLLIDWSSEAAMFAFEVGRQNEEDRYAMCVARQDGTNWTRVTEWKQDCDYGPVWSPDGTWLAFSRLTPRVERGLYLMHHDGSGLRLLAGGYDFGDTRAWSPDGSMIASDAWVDSVYDILLVDVETGHVRNLTGTSDQQEWHPTWSPDGAQIAFEVGMDIDGEIWIMDADGSGAHKIADGCCPAWQPAPHSETPVPRDALQSGSSSTVTPFTIVETAGDRIAFESDRDGNNEIYVMNPDGTGQTNLTNHRTDDGMPCWSPDGDRIAFMGTRDLGYDVYAMGADGSQVTRLTTDPGYDGWPSWSPDGSRVAFLSNDGQIHIINADGSDQHQLTNSPEWASRASWSPDGTKLAIAVDTDGHMHYQIYLINADGSNLTCLSDGSGNDQLPSWSPDGTRIAFASNRDGNMDIYTVRTDGSGVTRLTSHPSPDWAPCWSPDGRRIAFTTSRDGDEEVYAMNADGSEQVNLTNNPAWDGLPSWSPK